MSTTSPGLIAGTMLPSGTSDGLTGRTPVANQTIAPQDTAVTIQPAGKRSIPRQLSRLHLGCLRRVVAVNHYHSEDGDYRADKSL